MARKIALWIAVGITCVGLLLVLGLAGIAPAMILVSGIHSNEQRKKIAPRKPALAK